MATTDEPLSIPALYLQDLYEVERVFKCTAVMQTLGSRTSADEITKMTEEIDTDRDGFITLEEFAGFCKAGDGSVQELREAFRLYDININGLICSAELHQIFTRLGEKCTDADCVKMIQTVDSDGDGYVNFEEFKTMMSSSAPNSQMN